MYCNRNFIYSQPRAGLGQQLVDGVYGQLNQVWINAQPVGYFCSAEIAI